jgi:hypothetical protein
MALLVCNLTSSAVTLAKGSRTVVVPAKVGSLTYGAPINVSSVLTGLSAGDYTALETQRAGGGSPPIAYFWSDGIPLFAVGTLTVATNLNGVTVQNTTTTVSALVQSRKVEFPSTTKAAELISVVNAVLPSNVALTLALQPDVARKLQVRVVTGSTAGTLTLVGVDQNGNAATQAIDISTSGGTRTVITDKAYATLTSATISGGSGFAGTVGIGVGAALGIPTNKSPAATAFAIYKEQVNGADETVGTVDATAMTVIPTTAPDAAHSYAFWYNFTVTPTSPAHTHTLA